MRWRKGAGSPANGERSIYPKFIFDFSYLRLLKPDAILWANFDDSRIYAKDRDGLRQVSTDDVPAGLRSSNMITQCLGENYPIFVTRHYLLLHSPSWAKLIFLHF